MVTISKEQFKDILASRLNDTVAVVYDSPNNRLNYGEKYIDDPEVVDDIPEDTRICVDDINAEDVEFAVNTMRDNCEWWDEKDADRMSIINWLDNDCIKYMLVYDVAL